MIQIDRYTISARVLPAIVVAAPVAAAVYTWSPFVLDVARGAAATLVLAAVAYVLSHPTRNAGRALEERVWSAWGGAPSIAFLRHRDSTIDPVSKARYHASLIALGAVSSLPSASEEAASPASADHCYEAASTWLRSKTRDRKAFPLVFEENVNYGYLRNLLACRGWGLAGCVVGLASVLTAFWFGRQPIIETALTLVVVLYLCVSVTETALRRQAGTYAKRLIEAIDILAVNGASGTGVKKRNSRADSVSAGGKERK